MSRKYGKLHWINLYVRAALWFMLLIAVTITNMMPLWLAIGICLIGLIFEIIVHYGYTMRDQRMDQTIRAVIETMPLYDLIEILNKREDIKGISINELEERE